MSEVARASAPVRRRGARRLTPPPGRVGWRRMEKATQQYEVVLIPQPEGGFVVTVPDLPDVVSEGETREEALAMIRDAIEGYLETLRERGWPLRLGEREHVAIRPA